MKRVVIYLVAVLGMLELIAWHGPRLAWPVSDSLPRGLYLYVPGQAKRSEVARVCLPPGIASYALAHGIDRQGGDCASGLLPLGKVVAGVTGDVVDVERDGVRINADLWPQSRQKDFDSHGRRVDLRVSYGARTLGPDQVWLMGRSANSWDARYFGALPVSSIDGRFIPLFVQEKKQ
ncbi:MAG: S26 family signal peptidase [Vulcanimicrobiaceae bacterium]